MKFRRKNLEKSEKPHKCFLPAVQDGVDAVEHGV